MFKSLKIFLGWGLLSASALVASTQAAERPTLQVTCDPRPDILPYHLYYAHTEYRREYNRPRYYTGWLASKISATSQEAMVWRENYQAGNYAEHHMPPMYKRYFAPKPWEVLQTGPRPDFRKEHHLGLEEQRQQNQPAAGIGSNPNHVYESTPIQLE